MQAVRKGSHPHIGLRIVVTVESTEVAPLRVDHDGMALRSPDADVSDEQCTDHACVNTAISSILA